MTETKTKFTCVTDFFETLERKVDLSIIDGCGVNPFERFKCKLCKTTLCFKMYGDTELGCDPYSGMVQHLVQCLIEEYNKKS